MRASLGTVHQQQAEPVRLPIPFRFHLLALFHRAALPDSQYAARDTRVAPAWL